MAAKKKKEEELPAWLRPSKEREQRFAELQKRTLEKMQQAAAMPPPAPNPPRNTGNVANPRQDPKKKAPRPNITGVRTRRKDWETF